MLVIKIHYNYLNCIEVIPFHNEKSPLQHCQGQYELVDNIEVKYRYYFVPFKLHPPFDLVYAS